MNNAINEIKNTLEGTNSRTNSRIVNTEDRISEVEYIMVEINESERKKKIKRNEHNLRDSGTMLNTPTFES